MTKHLLLAFLGASCFFAAHAADSRVSLASMPVGNAENGAKLYEQRCGGCHSVESNRVGPKHAGLLKRNVAAVADFNYSAGLKKNRKKAWTPSLLDQWLTDPEKLFPGQAMGYRLSNEQERADIIEFLKTQ